jgi:SAM-dependent methyltransferase
MIARPRSVPDVAFEIDWSIVDPFLKHIREISEDEWLGLLARSSEEPVIDGFTMPGFPDVATQRATVGSDGSASLREAFAFRLIVKTAAASAGCAIGNDSKVLDFGCGWGRMIRTFLRDVDPAGLFGCDVVPRMIETCENTNLRASFLVTPSSPPSEYENDSFDVIYAYSVFSHLSLRIHEAWLQEFARILRPGGVVVATTHSRRFIGFCNELRMAGEPFSSAWHKALSAAFPDPDASLANYDSGKFVFSPTSGGPELPADIYGDAVVSPGFINSVWGPRFEILDFVDDAARLPQSFFVARRK